MSAAKLQRKPTEPYHQSIDEVLAGLNTDPRLGLSQAEARARLEKYGRNELTAEKPVPAISSLSEGSKGGTTMVAGLLIHPAEAIT